MPRLCTDDDLIEVPEAAKRLGWHGDAGYRRLLRRVKRLPAPAAQQVGGRCHLVSWSALLAYYPELRVTRTTDLAAALRDGIEELAEDLQEQLAELRRRLDIAGL